MPCKLGAFVLFACVAPAFAQTDSAGLLKLRHQREDQTWARRSGLTEIEVRAIRIIAGIADSDSAQILSLDANSLKQRNHILLTEIGNGHCMRVHVVERKANGFSEVWLLSDVPAHSWSFSDTSDRPGRGFCPAAAKSPGVHVTAQGAIVLEVPVLMDPFERSAPVSTYTFRWDGGKYLLADDSR